MLHANHLYAADASDIQVKFVVASKMTPQMSEALGLI